MISLPTHLNVASILRDLLGRHVSVKDNRARLQGDVLWAYYASEAGEHEAVWLWDITAGICVGAALTMVPADHAQQEIRKKHVDSMALENFQEVANVLGSLLNEGAKRPLILKEVGFADVKAGKYGEKAKALSNKGYYVVEIEGYGTGATELRCSD
jgi:hypothetical protein